MTLKVKGLFAALAFSTCSVGISIPTAAQEAEEARTTYSITYLKFAPGADQDRFVEMRDTYIDPTRAAVGMTPAMVHWMNSGDWDLMIVTEMPDGLASLDMHASDRNRAYRARAIEMAGSEEAFETMSKEYNMLFSDWSQAYSHTHP